jgi:solute carrier family 50 protein (sugar transporter)
MVTASTVVLGYVIPCIGIALTWGIYFSSLPHVHNLSQIAPDNINPIPSVLQLFNSTAWLAYGILAPMPTSAYCFAAHLPGIVLGLHYMLLYHSHVSALNKWRMRILSLTLSASQVTFFWVVGVCLSYGLIQDDITLQVLGYFAVGMNLLFFFSPLALLYLIMRGVVSKTSVYFPLTIVMFFSSVLWCIFGLFVKDYFIAIPNIIGIALSLIQLVVILI